MFEDIEGLSSVTQDTRKASDISQCELDYLKECIAPPRPDELVQRIDELQDSNPPKAIDVNPQIAEVIEPIREQIPDKYLEAPNDMEQVEQISDVMVNLEGLKFDEWKELSLDERVEVLNKLECQIAAIEHREPCPVGVKDMGQISEYGGKVSGHLGVHTTDFFGNEKITINSELIKGNNPIYYKEVLDTVIHEGRHSYQTYNLEHRQTHTSQGDLTNWKLNHERYGYQNSQQCGFKAYWLQPVEADARKFAEDVLTAYQNKL